jgi:hypothetical protein
VNDFIDKLFRLYWAGEINFPTLCDRLAGLKTFLARKERVKK